MCHPHIVSRMVVEMGMTLGLSLPHLLSPRQQLCKGVVYQISRSDCPATYVEQTGRILEHRINEHKYALTSGNVDKSAVAEHMATTGHTIKWEEAHGSLM